MESIENFKILLINKKFLLIWASQILSQLTINMMNFLLLVTLFEKTDSTFATALLWIAYALPAILIGPIASACVDIFDRKKVLVVTNLLQSLTILFYAITHTDKTFLAYSVAFFYSLLNQFYLPAESASLPVLVGKADLAHANGIFYLTQQLSLLIGYALAGIFNNLLGYKISILICSFFLFIAFLSVSFLPNIRFKSIKYQSIEKTIVEFFRAIFKGFDFIRSQKFITFTFIVLVVSQVLFTIIVVSVPAIAKDLLKVDPKMSGFYIVIPAALGALFGALNIPSFLKNKWRKRSVIEISTLIIGILFFVESLIISKLAILKIPLSFVTIFFVGVFFSGIVIPSQTFLQENTPDNLKGRIFGNFWFIVTIATIIPIVFTAVLIETLGIKTILFFISLMLMGFYIFSKKIIYPNNHKFIGIINK